VEGMRSRGGKGGMSPITACLDQGSLEERPKEQGGGDLKQPS